MSDKHQSLRWRRRGRGEGSGMSAERVKKGGGPRQANPPWPTDKNSGEREPLGREGSVLRTKVGGITNSLSRTWIIGNLESDDPWKEFGLYLNYK